MSDTAEEVGTITDCLYSTGNRVEIAKILVGLGKTKLLSTELEDIARFVQEMMDEHCVVKGEDGNSD